VFVIIFGEVYITVTCPNATTFTWQKTSGNINGYFPPGPTASFNMTSGGSISFLITAKNGSVTLATRNVAFYNYGSFTIYPNPAASTLIIDINKDFIFYITIESLDGLITKEIQEYRGGELIDISYLNPGEYSTKIYTSDKLLNQQRIFISDK
jgi:hypothetical protein